MPYIGKQLVRGQNRKLDDISSGFNGSQTTFTLQVASQNVTVGSALQLWISLGGVIQDPLSDYTIAGNQITFTTAPAAGLDFFGVIQGDVTDTNTPGDATVTTSKLSTGLTVNLADGSAATSSLQLGGTDSGLFSSAADKVNVTTGGVERLEIGDSEVVFNDPSNDVDFRVESNGNTHMLFVDAGNDRVGVGLSAPQQFLHVHGTNGRIQITSTGTGSASGDGALFGYDGTDDLFINNREATNFKIFNNGSERLRIDSSGNVGIGTTSPAGNLQISGSGDRSLLITGGTSGTTSVQMGDSSDADAGAILYDNSNNSMQFKTNASERMRIDSSGRLLINHTADAAPDAFESTLQLVDTSYEGSSMTIRRDVNTDASPVFMFAKSRSGSKGGHTSVNSGDNVGRILFYAADGTDTNTRCAEIRAQIDGTPGSNDMPGRLTFYTTTDGANSPIERFRIDSSGHIKHTGLRSGGGQNKLANYTVPSHNTSEEDVLIFSVANESSSNQITFGGGPSAYNAATEILFRTASAVDTTVGSERMRIDSSGRLLVGKSSHSGDALFVVESNHTSGGIIGEFDNNDSGNFGGVRILGGVTDRECRLQSLYGNSFFTFYTEGTGAAAERMRITSGGDVCINRTSPAESEKLSVQNGSNVAFFNCTVNSNVANIMVKHGYAQSSQTATQIQFRNASDTTVGSITSTSSVTAFNTSSDYRLKENVVDLDGAITRVKQLSPKRFNFIVDANTTVDGFLAHEAATVVPEAVTGTHDEVDDDNNPVYQGIDQSKLIPLLTAALQEAIEKIETLEAKVAALEAE